MKKRNLQIMFTPDDYEYFKEQAAQRGITTATYARMILYGTFPAPEDIPSTRKKVA